MVVPPQSVSKYRCLDFRFVLNFVFELKARCSKCTQLQCVQLQTSRHITDTWLCVWSLSVYSGVLSLFDRQFQPPQYLATFGLQFKLKASAWRHMAADSAVWLLMDSRWWAESIKINIHWSDVMLVALTPTHFSVLSVSVLVLSKKELW